MQGPGLHHLKERTLRRASRLVEPPTADPHGGWCGGWGSETPGYPISLHRALWCATNATYETTAPRGQPALRNNPARRRLAESARKLGHEFE